MAKKEKKEKGILFYEEGYAENYLYKRIADYLIKYSNQKYQVKHKNLKGEGNTRQIPNYYRVEIAPDGIEYVVFFCYDSDVSERAISKKPSIRWKEAKQSLKELGVRKVWDIKQVHSIEDILLKDTDGILRYLGLPLDTKINGYGDSALKQLYKQAGKVYVHSNREMMKRLIETLNIEHIILQSKEIFSPLISMFPDKSFD